MVWSKVVHAAFSNYVSDIPNHKSLDIFISLTSFVDRDYFKGFVMQLNKKDGQAILFVLYDTILLI